MKIRSRQPSHVGHDGLDRSLRYVEWATEPDTEDTSYTVDFAYLLRDASGFRIEQDRTSLVYFQRQRGCVFSGRKGFSSRFSPIPSKPASSSESRRAMYL